MINKIDKERWQHDWKCCRLILINVWLNLWFNSWLANENNSDIKYGKQDQQGKRNKHCNNRQKLLRLNSCVWLYTDLEFLPSLKLQSVRAKGVRKLTNLMDGTNQSSTVHEPATFYNVPCWAFFRDSVFLYFKHSTIPRRYFMPPRIMTFFSSDSRSRRFPISKWLNFFSTKK
jgi:hypothetical protein